MSTRSLVAVGLISLAVLQLRAGADVLELGQFYFRGEYPTIYSGEYEEYLAESFEGPYQRPVSEIHLGGIIEDFDLGSIAWIEISGPDTETSLVNPGADIDLFMLEGLSSNVNACYEYSGPNALYHNATSESLAAEVAVVDFIQGQSDTDASFVSLGISGSLLMWFEGVSGGGHGDSDGGDDDGSKDNDGDTDDGKGDGDTSDGGILDDVFDFGHAWGSPNGKIRGNGYQVDASIQGVSGLELWLRINEIAPIAEWVTIKVGYHGSNVPVPSPAGVFGLAAGAILIRRHRRR